MFKLTEKSVKLTNLNIRPELHGPEKVLGCDLSFSFEDENTVLDMFNPELRTMLYKEIPPEHQDLADQGQDDVFKLRRFPDLNKALSWDWKGAGYHMRIAVGISGEEDIYAMDSGLDKFKFEVKDGGIVGVQFRLQCKPRAQEIGQLSDLLTHESATLTLTPPDAEKRAQMELDEMREELRNNPAA